MAETAVVDFNNPANGMKVNPDGSINTSGGGGGAATIADGADVAEGATTSTAVTGDTAGSISAKLRGLNKAIADFWDSTNHWLQVKVMNGNNNGQTTMAGSAPVAIASNQPGLSQMANQDGVLPSNILALANYLYSSGGPVDSTGKPQQASWDRLLSWQAKTIGGSSANITATLAGDTNLVFGSAPKTLMPGQKIQLSIGTGLAVETVYVASTYTPSSTATTIPLQFAVVTANSTTAKWDVYSAGGPGTGVVLPHDLLPVMMMAYTNSNVAPITLVTAYADGIASQNALASGMTLYNGASQDRQRGNTDVTLLASAARTTTQTSADLVNYNGRGIKVVLDATVIGTGSITLTINYKDPASGKYITLLSGAAVVTNSTNVYTVYPGATAAANAVANDVLPRTFQIVVTANNANSVTYSCGYSIIL